MKRVKAVRSFFRKYGSAYLFIAPFFILFFIFQLFPMVWSAVLSFHSWDGLGKQKFIGLQNYQMILRDSVFITGFKNTFFYWVFGLALTLVLSMGLALLLNDRSLKGRSEMCIRDRYESIHWSGKREKFKVEHGDELNRLQKAIWLREKLVKSLGLASPLDKEQRAALKTERAQLEAEREALLPKLEEVRAELAELNRIRYWTRKVIPDALPRMSDGRVSVEDAMETAGNRKELEEIMEKTEQRVTRQQSEHEKNQRNQSPKDKLI